MAASAITSAGHVLALGTSGKEGLTKVKNAVTDGQIDVVLVGIPGGEAIIDAARALEPRRPVIIAACSGSAVTAVLRAHSTGADLATVRPHGVETLAPVLLAAARLVEQRRELGNVRGNEAVLRGRLEQLTDGESGGLQPFEIFQRTLELELKRAKRYKYSLSVALFAVEVPPPPPPPGVRGILRARAGNALIHSIRDIDMATGIDQERFLVLLPYTDLDGAAEVARRIIAAVDELEPVVATGRSFTPRLVGAVAGGQPGQQVSFSKLMRDATRALEQARKDGAELAVAP
jgi:PleD family two-component response regulator